MSTQETVYMVLQEISGREDIDAADDLQVDLGFDSLSMVTLLAELEEALGMELEEKDMNPFELITVRDVIELAEKYEGHRNEETR